MSWGECPGGAVRRARFESAVVPLATGAAARAFGLAQGWQALEDGRS